MIKKIISWLSDASPFLAVIVLWRLNLHFFNPAGILAIIPIFFYSFVRPIRWFAPFSILFCFLIDYCFDTKLFWTAMYCAAYAVIGFQYFIDIPRADKNAIVPFMIFFGIAMFILMMVNLSWVVLWRAIWLFIWVVAMYLPITNFMKKVHTDD